MKLSEIVNDVAFAIKRIDSRRPQAASPRSARLYQPGIGPHTETAVVALLANELPLLQPARYADRLRTNVPYPGASYQKCDLCLGIPPKWDWTIEVKMLRWIGDNGKPNDNMLTHILSPYPADRSALTDCLKLLQSSLHGRRAILIYGFDYFDRPMDTVIDEFELIASQRVQLSPREVGIYDDLIHPVHQCGRVFDWEIIGAAV